MTEKQVLWIQSVLILITIGVGVYHIWLQLHGGN